MKKLFLLLIGLIFFHSAQGQHLEVKVEIDTLKIVETKKIPDKKIIIGIKDGYVFLSKEFLLNQWKEQIKSLEAKIESDTSATIWDKELLEYFKSRLGFIKRKDYLKIDYQEPPKFPFTIQKLPPKTDTLYYMENMLKEIACQLIDNGEFNLQVNNVPVKKVVKARIYQSSVLSSYSSIEYLVDDTVSFWSCPPYIRADHCVPDSVKRRLCPPPPK